MSIFLFVLGLAIGFGVKLAFDQYLYFIKKQEKTQEEMEDILVKFKAIEIIKKDTLQN